MIKRRSYLDSLRTSIKRKIGGLISKPLFFPVLLLFVCLFAFAFFIPKLGFYWDDWPVLLLAKQGGLSVMQNFFVYDRPFLIFPYMVTIPLLGADPQNWQLLGLLLRFCAALAIWVVLRQVWPKHKLLAEEAALLFLVYPSFTEQSISVTYVPHFLALTMLFISLWFTIKAIRDPKKYLLLTFLALITGASNIFLLEYFAGLELIRFFVIFNIFRQHEFSVAQSLRRALLHWIPYLLLLFGFVVWRIFLANIPEDPNQLTLFGSLLASPIETFTSLTQDVLKDVIFILFSTWQAALNPQIVDLTDLSVLFSWIVGIFSGVCVAMYLSYSNFINTTKGDRKKKDWGGQAIGFGTLALLLGMIPVHLTQKGPFSGLFADRFTLPAMFGAAICWVGFAKLFVKSGFHRAILIAILVGLGIGMQIRVSHDYVLDWQKQSRIYWQLYWRSETIDPNTPLVFSGALSGFVSEYSASAAINTLYNSPVNEGRVNYWVFDYFDHFAGDGNDLGGATQIEARFRNLYFQGSLADAVFIHYSSQGQCLWVLNLDNASNVDIPSGFREVGSLGSLSSLNQSEVNGTIPAPAVFGDEPTHDWCYFFEKMDQARQNEDWARLLVLWDDAQEKSYRPNNQFELVPVLEALQNTNEWIEALELSRDMFNRQRNTQATLCPIWLDQLDGGNIPEAVKPELEEFFQDLGC